MVIAGKTALVTGAARGIGREIAVRLAREGAAVVVGDVDQALGHPVVETIRANGAAASFVAADITREGDVTGMVDHAAREFGSLDILVNNAGGYEQPVFPDASVAHWSTTLDLNLRGAMLAIQSQ